MDGGVMSTLSRAKGIRYRTQEKDKLSREEALTLIDEVRVRVKAVRDNLEIIQQDIIILWRNRGAEAVGSAGWEQLCREYFGVNLPLNRDDRNELARELLSAKMSTRAVGSAVGASEATVRRAGATIDAPAEREGLDGKTYIVPPKPPTLTHPKPGSEPAPASLGVKSSHTVKKPVVTPEAEEAHTPRRDAFQQEMLRTVGDIIHVMESLDRLAGDDRFEKYRAEVKDRFGSDIERAIARLSEFADDLNGKS